MENFEAPTGNGKSRVIVLTLVILGFVGVALGGYVAWSSKHGSTDGEKGLSQEVSQWCELRRQWANKVDPLVGDIILKSVRPEDKPEYKRLFSERNKICQEFSQRLGEMTLTDPVIKAVEIALVKEGKTRANISVEINNILNKVTEESTLTLGKYRKKLQTYIKSRIEQGKSKADEEIARAFASLGIPACKGIYRGPLTDEGTSDNPYTSWDELEFRRTTAIKGFDERIKELEPREEYSNRVYHEMVRHYRKTLNKCYQWAKHKEPELAEKMGLRLRLDRIGKIIGLAVEYPQANSNEKILDCLETKVAKWRLPAPILDRGQKNQIVVVNVDFSTI